MEGLLSTGPTLSSLTRGLPNIRKWVFPDGTDTQIYGHRDSMTELAQSVNSVKISTITINIYIFLNKTKSLSSPTPSPSTSPLTSFNNIICNLRVQKRGGTICYFSGNIRDWFLGPLVLDAFCLHKNDNDFENLENKLLTPPTWGLTNRKNPL